MVEVSLPFKIRTLKQAEAIAGTLGSPSKMPGAAWGISATACRRGRALAQIEGSVCQHCYAMKGHYRYPGVQVSHQKRLLGLYHPLWVDAMVFMISRVEEPFFRWFDSGDLQGLWHLEKIVAVCRRLPKVKFWLPTRELDILRAWRGPLPKNLTIRASGAMVDGHRPSGFPTTSTVVSKAHRIAWYALVADNNKAQHYCPAPLQNGVCGDCRACWDKAVKNTTYCLH